VRDQVCWRLAQRHPANRRTPRYDETALIAALDAHSHAVRRLNVSYYIDREITLPEYRHLRHELLDRAEAAKHQIAPNWRPPQLPPTVDLGRLVDHWDQLDREAQRAAISMELSHLTVRPRTVTNGFFDPARLDPAWRFPLPEYSGPSPASGRVRRRNNLWDYTPTGVRRIPDTVAPVDQLLTAGRLLNAAETAKVVGIEPATLELHARQGRIQSVRRGRARWYRPRDAASHRTKPSKLQPAS
jgi:hypothetical protein